MKQEIKKRIEEINNGIVPKGYEKTDFGIFPCDWEKEKTLGSLGLFAKGQGLPGDKMSEENDVPCIGYGDIYTKYNYHFDKARNFTDTKTAENSTKIGKGTLCFTGTGETAEEIGKCVCYNGNEEIYAGGDIILFNSKNVNPLFLAYQQYCDFSIRKKASFGQGHSVVHIHKENLEKMHVAYPVDTKEQGKIAEILMKWDDVIALQEQCIELITEKYKVLTKRIIDSVVGEKKKLADCVDYYQSSLLIKNLVPVDNGYPVYGANEEVFKIETYNFDCDTVAIIKYGSGVGRVCCLSGKHSVLGTMAEMTPKKDINIKYIYYVLKYFDFTRYIEISTTPNVYFEDYSNEKIIVPCKGVQDDIVYKLELFDKEISLQKQKLEKLKLQRKAMQQYLLTGVVRVC